MSIAPRSRIEAGSTRTLVAAERDTVADFLIDHGFQDDPEAYLVWVNRRRVGAGVSVEEGDEVTVGPKRLRKARPLAATRPRIALRERKRGELIAMLREWRDEATGEDSEAFEEFKKAINETRARAGRPPVYP